MWYHKSSRDGLNYTGNFAYRFAFIISKCCTILYKELNFRAQSRVGF